MDDVFGVMMAGGASSRFFPENKVFADPTGSGRSMVQQACDRLCQEKPAEIKPFLPRGNFFCVTGQDMADEMKQHLPDANVLAEPGRRNTLPAILWTMAHIETQNPGGTLIVVTGDHVIGDLSVFRSSLELAIEITKAKRAVVTVGIAPSSDANEWTAFGAIKSSKDSTYKEVGKIITFEEKPSLEAAEAMIKENCWAWNSGMFVFKMQLMRELLEEFQPEVYQAYSKIVTALNAKDIDAANTAFLSIKPKLTDPRGTGKMVDTSIDYAIMMRLTSPDYKGDAEGYCIPGTFYWMDIGSWNALRTVCPVDSANNVIVGNATVEDSQSIIVYRSTAVIRKLCVKRSKGVIVVFARGPDGKDWILICKEEMAQAVKQVREQALACDSSIVCESCSASCVQLTGTVPDMPRVACAGITKANVQCETDQIIVNAE